MIHIKTFFTKYFLLDIKDYLSTDFSLRINELLFFLFVGIALACLYAEWQSSIRYRGVRALLRHGAIGEEKAKTPRELGLSGQTAVLRALAEGGSLSHLVSAVGRHKPTYEEYLAAERQKRKSKNKKEKGKKTAVQAESEHFYLPEDALDRAKRLYDKSAPSLLHALLMLPLLLAVYVGIALLMPSLLQLAASFL